jgi:hypothetical protein
MILCWQDWDTGSVAPFYMGMVYDHHVYRWNCPGTWIEAHRFNGLNVLGDIGTSIGAGLAPMTLEEESLLV